MPGRRRMRKTSRRYVRKKFKRYGKRKFNSAHIMRNTKVSTGIPDRAIVKMEYEGVYAAVGPYNYAFRANSIFDPDYTGAGGQPLGHDQWANFYQRYRVFASKITVYACNTDSTNASILTIIPDNSTTLTYTNLAISEYPRARTWVLAPCNGGRSAITARMKLSCADVAGQTKQQYKNELSYTAQFGANPTNIIYWNLVFQNLESNSGAVGKQQFRARVTYYVELYDRVELAPS